ncbi:MAG: NUDIX hydrolase [Firmicutes bacterium]|nr:NUDIX hydrolase [Bacillota bacterium]
MIHLRVDTVKLPNGEEATREVVEHPGAVALIAVNQKDEMVFVKQFRQPVGEELIEIPAGKLQEGEDPMECALRELEEETGYTAGRIELISVYYTTPGFSDEKMYLYLATKLYDGEMKPDDDEFLEVVCIPPEKAREMVLRGELRDAKTMIGVLALCDRLGIKG